MKKPNSKATPKRSSGDIAHTIAKAGLSGIPVIGGPASEVFSAMLVPPLTRRRNEWIGSIVDDLRRLEDKIEGFRIENLTTNEAFITAITNATQIAIRNHQQEKLDALRNAVLNSALPNAVDSDFQLIFLNLIDTMTVSHLTLLIFLDDPYAWTRKHGFIRPPRSSMQSEYWPLDELFPFLGKDRNFCEHLFGDLSAKGLVSETGLKTHEGWQLGLHVHYGDSYTTDMGRKLVGFIKRPFKDIGMKIE